MATAAAIRQHYDSFAGIYRAFWGDHIHHGLFLRGDESPAQAQVQMLDHCCALAGVQRGVRVLDAGCGHGGTAIYLAQRFGCSVDGITLSQKQAALAREGALRAGVAPQTTFTVADAERYLFPMGAYQLVWTMESSEHFAAKPRYFENVARALRPGGSLLLAAWTGDMRSPLVRAVAEQFLCPALQTGDAYTAQVRSSGLQVTRQEEFSREVAHTWEICRQRAGAVRPLVKLLPAAHQQFIAAIDTILEAYRCGALTYSILVARKE